MYSESLSRKLRQYGDAHRNPTNALIHRFAVPFTMVGIVGMLPTWAAVAVLVAVLAWYATLDWRIVLPMGAIYGITILVTSGMHAVTAFMVFAAFMGLQVYGHIAFEKQRPSFADNLSQLFIGPVYYWASLTGRLPKGSR